MMKFMSLLAQAGTTAPASPAPMPRQDLGWLTWMPLIAMGLIFYFIMIRPQGAERKRRAAMLAGLKKNDRVVTIGGIMGTVVAVKDDEVTVKVDESTNTKLTLLRSAIQRVVAREQRDAASPDSPAGGVKATEPADKR